MFLVQINYIWCVYFLYPRVFFKEEGAFSDRFFSFSHLRQFSKIHQNQMFSLSGNQMGWDFFRSSLNWCIWENAGVCVLACGAY